MEIWLTQIAQAAICETCKNAEVGSPLIWYILEEDPPLHDEVLMGT